MERMATRGFGAKKIATTLGLPQSTTKRWLLRLRSDGDMASHNTGSMAAIRSAFLPQRAVMRSASVRKRLQASGIELGRSSVQECMKAEQWPAKQTNHIQAFSLTSSPVLAHFLALFSACHSQGFLPSRSTSRTDALDDDET